MTAEDKSPLVRPNIFTSARWSFILFCRFLSCVAVNFRSVHRLIELSLKRKSLESKSRTDFTGRR